MSDVIAKIEQLTNKSGQYISPFTHIHAVYDSEGKRLDQRLASIDALSAETKQYQVEINKTTKEFNEKIGPLSALTTESKGDLVSAINEINAKPTGSSGATKPSSGWSKSDLSTDVQASLNKADSSYQKTDGVDINENGVVFSENSNITSNDNNQLVLSGLDGVVINSGDENIHFDGNVVCGQNLKVDGLLTDEDGNEYAKKRDVYTKADGVEIEEDKITIGNGSIKDLDGSELEISATQITLSGDSGHDMCLYGSDVYIDNRLEVDGNIQTAGNILLEGTKITPTSVEFSPETEGGVLKINNDGDILNLYGSEGINITAGSGGTVDITGQANIDKLVVSGDASVAGDLADISGKKYIKNGDTTITMGEDEDVSLTYNNAELNISAADVTFDCDVKVDNTSKIYFKDEDAYLETLLGNKYDKQDGVNILDNTIEIGSISGGSGSLDIYNGDDNARLSTNDNLDLLWNGSNLSERITNLEIYSASTTASIGELYDATFPIKASISITQNTNINPTINTLKLSVTQGNKGGFVPDSLTLTKYVNNGVGSQLVNESVSAKTITSNIEGNIERFDLVAKKEGRNSSTVSASRYVVAYGVSEDSVISDTLFEALTKKLSTSVSFNPTISTELNQYIWLLVPSSLSINKVTSAGFDVTMEAASNHSITSGPYKGVYKAYRTKNPLASATWTLSLS